MTGVIDFHDSASRLSVGLSRRHFLSRMGFGVGSLALGHLLDASGGSARRGLDFFPKAKRVICLFQSGAPSQLDLFDDKPLLRQRNGEDLPPSVRQGQRLTSMSASQAQWPLAGSQFRFRRWGQGGAVLSELLPHTAALADELCFVKTLHTEAINHDPAITFLQTGTQLSGRPSLGAWLSYGLGSENENLPAFVVLISKGQGGQPVYDRLWGSGFLPSNHQGVRFRSGRDPILYLSDPRGLGRDARRLWLRRLEAMHRSSQASRWESTLEARIAQYEMAFRMQLSVPEVTDLSGETKATFEAYGPGSEDPGTFAANCLLARRLAERGVRCIQLFHRGWDQHGNLPKEIAKQCLETDQASAALVRDLKQRGLLEETLVIWGGEFGRTCYSQGALSATNYGRDHHPRCFSIWMAGGGIRPGMSFGQTDDFGYNIAAHPVSVHDLHATLLRQFGVDHQRLTYKHQGRRFRLTDVFGDPVQEILS